MFEAIAALGSMLISGFIGFGFLGGVAVVVALAVRANQRSSATRQAAWRALAQEHGLTYTEGGWFQTPTVHGVLDGHRVLIDIFSTGGKNSQTYTRVAFTPPTALPAGLKLTREGFLSGLGKLMGSQDIEVGAPAIDALHIRGRSEEDVRTWMSGPELAELPRQLSTGNDNVTDEHVQLWAQGVLGADLRSLFDRARFASHQLELGRVGPWRALGGEPGLTLVEEGDRFRAEGVLEGVRVRVVGDAEHGVTRIVAAMPEGVPAGLRIVRGSSDLGDPILDRMISASGASEAELRDLLCHDGIREDLLSVVHAHPGSVVGPNEIVVDLKSFSDPALPTIVRDTVELANRFRDRLQQPADVERERRPMAPKTTT